MGKSGSKLKKKSRRQSIAWSFRFPSLASLSRRKMPAAPTIHLGIAEWLTILELSQYKSCFEKYAGVEELLAFSEAEIKEFGVKNASHRARMVSSLVALRSKYEKGKTQGDKNQRHSVAVDSSRLVNLQTGSDILVISNVTQSKSLCNIKMEATPDPTADPVQLRKALEWELSLDNRDLRSHAWYHGSIPRSRAEEILVENGDFLVRDCASQPGNYVLSCRSKGQGLHFVINKVVIQPDTVYERVQYQFEDDAYDTVPDLITYYVGSGKPITGLSGAKISNPRNRLYPLTFYATKYGLQQCGGSGRSSQSVSPLASPLTSAGGSLRASSYSYRSPVHSPPRTKREIPPRLPSKKQRSQSLTPSEANGRISLSSVSGRNSVDDRSNSADGVILDNAFTARKLSGESSVNGGKFSTHSLPRGGSSSKSSLSCSVSVTIPRNNKIVRVTSDPALSPCLERRNFGNTNDLQQESEVETEVIPERPPPKPSRLPSLLRSTSKESSQTPEADHSFDEAGCGSRTDNLSHSVGTFQRVVSYHASGSDSGNGSGDSIQSSAAGDGSESTTPSSAVPPINRQPAGVIIKNPRYYQSGQGISLSCSSSTLKAFEYDSAVEDSILLESAPEIESSSIFDVENYQTLLLPTLENKPLDGTALQGVRMMLQETASRILANHLTRIDLEVTVGNNSLSVEKLCNGDFSLGVSSPIEMLAMPIGHQFRLDLIERTRCLRLLVAVTILTCTSERERAEMLNKWIEVAVDTKTALGNLFGFGCIMLGICMPQVQRLTSTWHVLRQKFTDGAFNFEAKLRPTLKSMNDCTNPQAPNTTIPHLIPFVLLLERNLDDIMDTGQNDKSTLEGICLSSWEMSTSDFGLTTLFSHLEAARKFGESIQMFRRNAEIVLGDSKVDDLLLDMFRTEFHLKFLWGSRGAAVSPDERHSKFEKVLTVMSEKCEPPEPASSARSQSPTASSASPSHSRSSSQLHTHTVPYNPTIGTSV